MEYVLFFYQKLLVCGSMVLIMGGQFLYIYCAMSLSNGQPLNQKLAVLPSFVYGTIAYFGIVLMSMINQDLGTPTNLLRIYRYEAIYKAPLPFVWLLFSTVGIIILVSLIYALVTKETELKGRLGYIFICVFSLQFINYVYFEYFMGTPYSTQGAINNLSGLGYFNKGIEIVNTVITTVIGTTSVIMFLLSMLYNIKLGYSYISREPRGYNRTNLFVSGMLLFCTSVGITYSVIYIDFLSEVTVMSFK